MESICILFKGDRKVTLRMRDMIGDNIARIFQVHATSLYITSDDGVGIFPASSGHFRKMDLKARGRYEVHGVDIDSPVTKQTIPLSDQKHLQVQITAQTTSAPGSPHCDVARTDPKASSNTFQRSVHIVEAVQGKLKPACIVGLRLSESEATTTGVLARIYRALQSEDLFTLTDAKGKKIEDWKRRGGYRYWKKNEKKLFAVSVDTLHEFKDIWSLKDVDFTGLQEVHDKVEEVMLAAPGLTEVITVRKDMSTTHGGITSGNMVVLNDTMITQMKEAFICIVCKGLMEEPMIALCCRSFVGCKNCVEQWKLTSSHCLKCRADEFYDNTYRMIGLDNVLSILGDVIKMD